MKFNPREAGRVVIFNDEDDAGTTIRPRLESMGADLSKIFIATCQFDFSDQSDLAKFVTYLKEIKPTLVIIDPIQSFVGTRTNMSQANHVRAINRPLIFAAQEVGCAILVIGHTNKNNDSKLRHKALGSVDFVAATRSALTCIEDPDVKGSYLAVHTKANLSQRGDAISYKIDDGKFVLQGTKPFDEAQYDNPVAAEARNIATEIADYLRDALKDGPKPAKDLVQVLLDMFDVSKSTIENVKRKLGIISKCTGGKNGKKGLNGWEWSLPA